MQELYEEEEQEEDDPDAVLLSPLQGFRILVSNLHTTVTQDDIIVSRETHFKVCAFMCAHMHVCVSGHSLCIWTLVPTSMCLYLFKLDTQLTASILIVVIVDGNDTEPCADC